MKLTTACMECLLRRNLERARALGTEEQAMAFARDYLDMLARGPEDAAAPYYAPGTAELLQKHYGLPRDYMGPEKAASNALALRLLPQMEAEIAAAKDSVLRALQGAILGNYLDFGALDGQVDFGAFEEKLKKSAEISVDPKEYENFCGDLEKARRLLYLTDNAGEITFDLALGRAIRRQYPHLEITYCVRGGPALNDATRADAQAVGLTEEFPVIDNGTAMTGTDLARCGRDCRQTVESADVILSKGQANVETLFGCGYNVYYAFLCKCSRFQTLFWGGKLEPMFCNERRVKILNNP